MPPAPLDRAPALRDLSEDELLSRLLPLLGSGPGVILGPGDDTAVLAVSGGAVLATTDVMVRDRDWRDDWSSAADVGHKTVAQNVADIAAMGGRPTGLLVSLAADPDLPVAWAEEFTRGVAGGAADAGAPVLGGDLSSAPPGQVTVSVSALGEMAAGQTPVLRSGARPGDIVAVAGSLGRSDAGLRLLAAGTPDRVPEWVAYHRRPRPPYEQGPAAAAAGATSMIDLSDGLVRDAGRVALASGVAVALDTGLLAADLARLAPVLGQEVATTCVLTGGEEHSLLATFPGLGSVPAGWRRIGVVAAGSGVWVDGQLMTGGGWDHFAG